MEQARFDVTVLRFEEFHERNDECTSCPFYAEECSGDPDKRCLSDDVVELLNRGRAHEAELERMAAELEQVKRERDAYLDSMKGICATCKKAKYCMLSPLPKCPNWQWRGVKEEE